MGPLWDEMYCNVFNGRKKAINFYSAVQDVVFCFVSFSVKKKKTLLWVLSVKLLFFFPFLSFLINVQLGSKLYELYPLFLFSFVFFARNESRITYFSIHQKCLR